MWRRYLLRITSFDERSLAVFRILLGAMILVDLVDRVLVFEIMYTERGLNALEHLREVYGRAVCNVRHFSLHMLHGGALFQAALFVSAAACAVCLMLGWHTRFFTAASWVLHVSVLTRNAVYGSAADTTLGLMLFWGMFLPLGAALSLDRRRQRSAPVGTLVARVGGACYLAQVSLVYVCAALVKSPAWHDGTALGVVMNWEMTVTPLGFALTKYPGLLSAMTHGVYYLELLGTLLLFSPVCVQAARSVAIVLFMGLHVGIALTLDIGLFPFFSLVLWLPFVPGAFWRWGAARIRLRARQRPDGPADLSRSRAVPQPSSPVRRAARAAACLLALGTLGSIAVTTVPAFRTVFHSVPGIPRAVYAYLSFTKLRQTWSVFATDRYLLRDGWFLIAGTLPDGREVDIMRGSAPADWTRPSFSGKPRLSIVWTTYLSKQERGDGENLERFAAYWNWKQKQKSPDGTGFTNIRMVFIEDQTDSKGNPAEPKRVEFWSGPPP